MKEEGKRDRVAILECHILEVAYVISSPVLLARIQSCGPSWLQENLGNVAIFLVVMIQAYYERGVTY